MSLYDNENLVPEVIMAEKDQAGHDDDSIVPGKVTHPSKRKNTVTQGDVLREQYNALLLKQENLILKTRKLELEVVLLKEKVHTQQHLTTINFSPLMASSYGV